ncbi:hypothetical protein BH23CHL7_BH23CHL7_19880 [soil metagenome]
MSQLDEPTGEPATAAGAGRDKPRGQPDTGAQNGPSPTAAQLRRFIKSRPYVPLHELRRRFELNGEMDEVCPIVMSDGLTVYVGLPPREARVLADLARDGDVGLEFSRDPRVPIVVGVYAMKPVARG